MNGNRPDRAQTHTVYEGSSERRFEMGEEKDATLEEALRDLWARSGPGEKRLRVFEIEVYGSNPIDMVRVAATD